MKRLRVYDKTVIKSPTSNPVQLSSSEQQTELPSSQPDAIQQSKRCWMLITANERLVARHACNRTCWVMFKKLKDA